VAGAAVAGVPPDPRDWSDFGPLAPYLALPAVTDVLVAADGALWLDEGAGLRRDTAWSLPEPELRALAVRLIARGGRHVDEASPCADVRIRDGVRVHVVLPPISTGGTLISVRVPRAARLSLDELEESGMVTRGQTDALRGAVAARRNVLVTGATGSGKTTLLAALLALAPPSERIVVVEDVAELRVAHPHVVGLEARQANLEGAGEVGLARLVREALRMRPDRLVVGECRGAEVRELFAALNTGHDGGAGTLHANSLADVPARIEALGALAGLDAFAVARQAASAIGLVVHLGRPAGRRRVEALGTLVVDPSGRLQVEAM
jgi:pilus assembly protein CpaF